MSTSDFRTAFLATVRAAASVHGELTRVAFFRETTARLMEAEELSDIIPCFFNDKGSKRQDMLVDGFLTEDIDVDQSVSIVVCDFRGKDDAETLITTEINVISNKVLAFVEESFRGKLHEELEQSTPAFDFSSWLFEHREGINVIKIYIVSDAAVSTRLKDFKLKEIGDVRTEVHVWDIVRFERAEGTGGKEPIEIDLREFHTDGLPALQASLGETDYGAYLSVVPGIVLTDLYDRYGSRLLEGNVRAFLSATRSVNKGIRSTILNEPERFFAYNNGISATATDIETEVVSGQLRITRLRDLQIVNGGQTTASIFTAHRKDKADLDKIFVQLKLSVVSEEKAPMLIPLISRYANSQNKVSDADFFSNHPLHIVIEEYSRRIWAPPRIGVSQHQTRWFYERARGQYANEQTRLTPAKKKEFLAQCPKSQLMVKTDIAKYENTWAQLPHVVSLGAQKNFVKYAELVSPKWEADKNSFNELWFKRLVAKAILFSETETIVSDQPWYSGGYRANIVTYALSLLSYVIDQLYPKRFLDFESIWKKQGLTPAAARQVALLAKAANDVITNPPEGISNVTEWAKKPLCWERLKQTPIKLDEKFAQELIDSEEERTEKKDARFKRREDSAIALLGEVMQQGQDYWARMLDWGRSRALLTPTQAGVIEKMALKGRSFVPTDAQARVLHEAMKLAEEEGFR